MEHVSAAIKWLATFHAITYAFLGEYDRHVDAPPFVGAENLFFFSANPRKWR